MFCPKCGSKKEDLFCTNCGYKDDTNTQSNILVSSNTPVNKIINPLTVAPGAGLDEAAYGQRYLILQDIGSASNSDGPDAWGDVVAGTNDIIEYDGDKWAVSFDSSTDLGVHYVTNTNTSIQYRWTGSAWVKSYEGEYRAGDWLLVI